MIDVKKKVFHDIWNNLDLLTNRVVAGLKEIVTVIHQFYLVKSDLENLT